MAYYLTYRPQKIGELDNENVRDILYSVLSQNDTPHAYLFTGPKGLGKTSSARLVAKSLNCTGRKTDSKKDHVDIEPCNTCSMCVSITNGSNMDILEIDAASNRGIDEIRELRDKIRLAPSQAKKKVYIIDEVHMLTTEAFNALLKTLEEPPKHAVFILATTEPHKVPETIISRCLHVSFSRATDEELVRSLQRIVDGEKIKGDKEVLESIAQLSDGGFRDGAKILEELVSLSKDKKITTELLEKRFHIRSTRAAVEKLLKAFGEKNSKDGFIVIKQLSQDDIDFSYLLQKIIETLHTILLIKTGVKEDTSLKKIEPLFSLSDLTVLFSILSKASSDMKITVIPELPLELALVEWSQKKEVKESASLPEKAIKEKVEEMVEEVTVKSLRKEVGDMTKRQLLESAPLPLPKEETKESNVNLLAYKSEGDLTDEWIGEFWDGIIHKMRDYNHTLAGVMRGCKVKSFDRKTLIIETKFKFHKES